ncbi:S1C family serine protease [Roseomonas sp. CCTCC AB2023176]|uniref:S1C family serine protease n=1 Tax=Roseomonas sp. CCTCC AB2023176 TaxID=3342640 RepID=UPI0035D5A45A
MSTSLHALSDAIAGIVAGAAPSIVSVRTARGRSSGFVWRDDLVVTAEEALPEDTDVAVVTTAGTSARAEVIGRDPSTDVVLLRAPGLNAPPLPLSTDIPAVGRLALAVGAAETGPFASLGIVATTGPAWRSLRGGQIDALIRLGLSMPGDAEGGVALDDTGRAFGMAVFGPRRRVIVIPAATIGRVAERLSTHGRVARGWLGLGLQPVAVDGGRGAGAMVMTVADNGPGAHAGLRQGDIILAWAGAPVTGLRPIMRALGPESVGTDIPLSVKRGETVQEVRVTIAERPAA